MEAFHVAVVEDVRAGAAAGVWAGIAVTAVVRAPVAVPARIIRSAVRVVLLAERAAKRRRHALGPPAFVCGVRWLAVVVDARRGFRGGRLGLVSGLLLAGGGCEGDE